MKRSDSIGQIAAALAEAQRNFDPILKAQTAEMGKYKYAFADLSDVLAAVRPHLNEQAIAVMQTVEDEQMATYLLHKSGEWLCCTTKLVEVGEGSPQEIGSGLTYSRRYGLCVALGVVGETDDDAKSAQSNPTARTKPHAVPERPNPRMDPMTLATKTELSTACARGGHKTAKDMLDICSAVMTFLAKRTIIYKSEHEITQSDAEMILAELARRYPDKVTP